MSFVREASLIGACGLLAVLGFLAGLLVPRAAKLTYMGLLALALVVITAIPYLPGSLDFAR